MENYEWITDEMFYRKLHEFVSEMAADYLLGLPGIYEILSEHFNNEILSSLENERQMAQLEDIPPKVINQQKK